MYTTTVSELVRAPRPVVYRALLDASAIAEWRVPDGMHSEVHEFDPREGGAIRISLTYDEPDAVGKSAANTDTFAGRFVRLVTDELVVETAKFESDDPSLGGEMTMTTTLADADGGTRVTIRHEGIPDSVSPADNETGTRMALAKLASYCESSQPPPSEHPAEG